MDQLALLFALLLGAVVSVPVGERLKLPAPVLMTVFGIVLALLNFVPNVDVPPELILPLLLPPLLYAAVRRTSWRQFAANVRPILLLAVALVFVTTFCVAVVAHAIVPGLPLAAAVALGALVAPPDPVAATAVAGKLGLPRRLVSILEGEGLFNDVTAIVLYHVAVAAAVSGTFSPWSAGLDLVLSAVVAVAVGLVLGWATNKAMDLLGDPTLQVALTLLVPFAAYVLAEELHGSGVLGVLVAALFLVEYATDADDVMARLAGHTFWDIVDTLVTGVAFGLVGLELHNAVETASGHWAELLGWSAAVVGVVVLVRLAWLLPATWLTKRMHTERDVGEDIPLSWRETVVMWWSGMRGVASVALALAIPLETDSGADFPPGPRSSSWRSAWCWGPCWCRDSPCRGWWASSGCAGTPGARRRWSAGSPSGWRRPPSAGCGRSRTSRTCRRSCPSNCCAGRSTWGCGSARTWRTTSGVRATRQRAKRLKRVRRIEHEMLSAARHEVLSARSEPGADPEVVDRVLRHLDVRSLR